MFKALMGGGDASSRSSRRKSTADGDDARSSSRRQSKRSSASSVSSSRRSTRGDDRDRDLGDLSASRSVAGESTATYVTAEPQSYAEEEPLVIERVPRYVTEEEDRAWENKSSRRDSKNKERRDTKQRSARDEIDSERVRTRSGKKSSSAETTSQHFADDIAAPGFNQFPMQYDAAIPGPSAPSHSPLDPHLAQQFPGQMSGAGTQPYIPPNPAGLAAEYYGDQGQSVANQPGVRPRPPDVIVGAEPHLMSASPLANPPPEPSSLGQVGAAADYYAASDLNSNPTMSTPSKPSKPGKTSKPSSKPSKQSKPSKPTPQGTAGVGAATYGISPELLNQASSNYPGMSGSLPNPTIQQITASTSPQHGIGLALGGATAGAAAAYMINHHHSNSDHQNDTYGIGVPPRPGNFTSNGNTPAQGGPVYNPQYLNGPPPTYPSGGMQPGSLAYHQRHHGPLAKFIDFWKDPEGVGKFEDYTEAIGVCKYCFEPGSSSRDAPRKHHYNRRKRSPVVERYGSSTRVDKLSRYASSEDESRRSKSKSGSWLAGGLAGGLAGYVAKSLFNNKDFDDTYSVRSGRQVDSRSYNYDEASAVSSGKASSTSRGVYSSRPVSDSKVYTSRDSRSYKASRRSSRSRSRSRSRDHRGLKEAAIGAAVGSALTAAAAGSVRHRSTSRNRSNSREKSSHRHIRRISNSSEHLYIDGPRGRRRSSPKGFKSFFSAPSANRRKKHASKRRGFFSFGNSSSSSGDYDLAFGGSEVFGSSVSGRSSKSSRSINKHSKPNVDAEILGLGLAARQLAHASSSRRDVHPRDLARPSKHSGPLSHEDEEWEDAESSDSALSTNLAYGGSEPFGSQESVGGSSFWPWSSSKKEKRRLSNQEFAPTVSNDYGISPSGLQNYSSSTLQQVYPVPTGDPSRFDAVRMSTSSSPNVQPPLVRPGPIPLQQPQPITPVSQSVYYPSTTGPPILPGDSQFTTRSEDAFSYPEPHRRNSSPVIPTAPLDGTPSPGILKRRSTAKDSAAVSFALTQEQADRQQKADRREKERLARRREENRLREETEEEERLQERNDRKREERRRREELEAEEAAREARRQTRREEIRDERESEDRSSSSWVTPAVAAVGTAAVASIVAENFSKDKKSTSNRKRYEESREKRRSERRRASENQEDVTEMSYDEDRQYDNEDEYKKKEERIAKIAASRIVRNKSVSPTYESYVDFFKPEELQNETSHDIASIDRQNASDSDISVIPPVRINIIEPTPPASHDGSVRDTHSPVPTPEPTIEEQPREEDAEAEVELYWTNSGSRVSWGEDRTHEYEVVTPLSEKDEPEPINDYHDNISLRRDPVEAPSQDGVTKGTAQEDQTSQNVEKHYMPGGFEDDSEFAATLAAGAEMAGFDPSVVTHDASYYRRDSPPGSELKGTYRSSIVESVEDSSDRRSIASRVAEKTVPDVGEKIVPKEFEPTDSSDKKSSKDEPKEKQLYEQNTDIDGEGNVDFGDTSRSVASVPVESGRKKSKKSKKSKKAEKAAKARNDTEIEPEERSESLPSVETPTASQYEDRALDRAIVDQKSDSDKVEENRSNKSSRSRKGLNNELEERSTPLPSTENSDVFQYEDKDRDFKSDSDGAWKSRSKKSTKTRKDSDTEPEELSKRPSFTEVPGAVQEDDEESYRDTVEYKSDSDKVQETRSKKSSKSRKDIDTEPETDSLDYKNTSDKVREIKEDWDEDERERRRRKSKRSSKDREDSMDDARSVAASAPGADELEKYRSRRSKRDEEDFDDDTRSLYDVDGDGDKRRRRRHKRHSGAFDDDTVSVTSAPANIDETREKRRSRESSVAKEKEKEADQDKKSSGFFSNLFGSKSTVERSSASSDKRDVRSEVGVDEYSKSERRRKKRSSGAFSEASQSVMDLSQPVRGNEGEESEDDSLSSRRRRREQERRNKYEGIVGSARDASEKVDY
ncbi:hypothetical protein BGW36DRAFT_379981 [Talaromyces proteolyticus]|uniref:Involucrin repeat protein n=1 Tax=Talaromyces proteolyticus TaxID=1131652 RepID=A0AAD4PZJ6_9EURO|nr:uncharacterized protein BGW36DRAFT_379981 [Talaromyces proteolyticus]KAH8695963.1 hypothetical protein BGW36DRAFT_379981 [Talaromyces proteolyticus]